MSPPPAEITILTEDGKMSKYQGEKSDFYDRLVTEAPLVKGDHEIPPAEITFDWVDPELIKEGQRYYRENFIACTMSSTFSLLMGLSFRRMCGILLKTGYMHRKEKSMERWVGYSYHTKLWLESDVLEKITKGAQDVYATRKVHAAALKNYNRYAPLPEIEPLNEKDSKLLDALHKDLECIDESRMRRDLLLDYHPEDPMTQFDMALGLISFFGYIVFFPNQLGATDDPKGLQGFIHVWAVIGKLLGIEDRFNPALHFDDQVSSTRIIMDIMMPAFKHSDKYLMTIWNTSLATLGRLSPFPFFRTGSIVHYFVHDFALNGQQKATHVYDALSLRDKLGYKLMKFFIRVLQKVWIVRVCANTVSRWSIDVLAKIYL